MLLTLGCAEAHGQSHLWHRVVTMPIEVNGILANFLVDTGSDCTVIDSTFADRLGLKPSGTVSLERNYSTEERATVSAEHIRIGPRTWTHVSLVLLDLDMLSRAQIVTISGVLGTDLLADMRIKLSYASGTAGVAVDSKNSGVLVALSKRQKRYFVPVRIGPSRFDLLLDSGTNMTTISESAWRSLPPSWRPKDIVEGVLSSGSPPGFIACLPELNFGGRDRSELVLRKYPFRVIMPSQSGGFSGTAFAGILGGDILQRFRSDRCGERTIFCRSRFGGVCEAVARTARNAHRH